MLTQVPSSPEKVIGRVSAMAMLDEEFKERLTADPQATLVEEGLDVPLDYRVEILTSFDDVPAEPDEKVLYLVIPEADELSDEDLSIATIASTCQSTASSACTTPSCLSSASTASTQCG